MSQWRWRHLSLQEDKNYHNFSLSICTLPKFAHILIYIINSDFKFNFKFNCWLNNYFSNKIPWGLQTKFHLLSRSSKMCYLEPEAGDNRARSSPVRARKFKTKKGSRGRAQIGGKATKTDKNKVWRPAARNYRRLAKDGKVLKDFVKKYQKNPLC